MQRVADSLDDLVELREWLHRQPVIALDTETTGLDIYSPSFRVRTVQLGSRSQAWFVPVEHGWYGAIREMLASYGGEIAIHNASYDTQVLARHDIHIPWHQIIDTMICLRLSEPHKPAGLKPAATRHVSKTAASGQEDLKKAMRANKWDWATIPVLFPAYVYYSSLDVILLARLLESKAVQDGLDSPIYRMEMDVRAICSRMEAKGMRVDVPFCLEQSDLFERQIDVLHADLSATTGGINPRSPGELARWCVDNGGIIAGRTATGSMLATKESLEECALTAPPHVERVIREALRLRKLAKIKSSYLDNFVEMADSEGFIHPSINTIHAKTGRMSISSPALQTLPSDGSDPDYSVVRRAVIPWEEGHKLVSCDYSQIELRAIANASGDDLLINAFLDSDSGGSDFFTEAMRAVYDDPTIPKSDRRRHGVKTLFYAFAYGAGINKIAATAGMPVPEMTEIRDRVLARYPGMKTLTKRFEAECKASDGWIETIYGRKVYVDPEYAYKALNGFIQGSAADILKDHLVELAHAGFEDNMVVPVHDEIVFSLPEEDIPAAQPIIGGCMTDLRYAVPLLADPSDGGDTWAELK